MESSCSSPRLAPTMFAGISGLEKLDEGLDDDGIGSKVAWCSSSSSGGDDGDGFSAGAPAIVSASAARSAWDTACISSSGTSSVEGN